MKETGMSIEDLKRYTTLWKLGEEGIPEIIDILSKASFRHNEKS